MKRNVLMILVVLLLAGSAQADIPSITNDSSLTGPGTTAADIVWKGQLTSSLAMGAAEEDTAQLFRERTGVVLSSDLNLAGGGVVPAGTTVNSYIVHFDPVGSNQSPVWECKGTITFDEPVLGLIYATSDTSTYSLLTASDDSVGLGSAFYESNTYHRKLEIPQSKWQDVANNTVYLNLFTNTSMDEVRIVTVPAPGALVLGLVGTSLVAFIRRKKAL
jgi:hypothetical protein